MRRLLLLVGFGVLMALAWAAPASADVVFTDNATSEFGIDEDGTPTGAQSGEMVDGWTRFWRTPEGQRIFTYLELSDVVVIVDVLPADQVGSGESAGRAYGTERIEARDELGYVTRIRIKIRNERTGGASNLAETIWHELRHAEIDLQGQDHQHDELDGEESDLNKEFRAEVEHVVSTSTTLDPDPPTPHYDRITARAAGEDFKVSAWLLGDILEDMRDSISFNTPTYYAEHIDLEAFGATKYDYGQFEVDVTFNDSILECGDQAETHVVVCAAGMVQAMPPGEVGVFVMDLAGDVPLTGGDHSLIYSVVFDSDRDPANDWVFNPPFDWDYFQGTDRWYQLMYDHTREAWGMIVYQLGSDGVSRDFVDSTVRAVVEEDLVVFFISMTEFPAAEPAYRFSAFGHDGNYSESDRGGDVSGDNPTEPPIPLAGSATPAEPQP